jgi:hypothetical protein
MSRTDWIRNLAVSAIAALFLAFAGAFGTDGQPFALRVIYWLPLLLAGALWGGLAGTLIFGRLGLRPPGWAEPLVLALAISLPLIPLVWLAPRLAFRAPVELAQLPAIAVAVLVISLIMTSLNMALLARRRSAAAAAPPPPKFLERLPLKLRGAEIWAVEAEDHYLRRTPPRGRTSS